MIASSLIRRQTRTKPLVVVALSGGVDSSVVAWMLRYATKPLHCLHTHQQREKTNNNNKTTSPSLEQVTNATKSTWLETEHYRLHGVHMMNWTLDDALGEVGSSSSSAATALPCAQQDQLDAEKTARKLQIPFSVVSFDDVYWERVFMPVVAGFSRAQTLNGDILCNKHVKFGCFLEYCTQKLGADYIATGHYARVLLLDADLGRQKEESRKEGPSADSSSSSLPLLAQARCLHNDQSYFLAAVARAKLCNVMLPLGLLPGSASLPQNKRENEETDNKKRKTTAATDTAKGHVRYITQIATAQNSRELFDLHVAPLLWGLPTQDRFLYQPDLGDNDAEAALLLLSHVSAKKTSTGLCFVNNSSLADASSSSSVQSMQVSRVSTPATTASAYPPAATTRRTAFKCFVQQFFDVHATLQVNSRTPHSIKKQKLTSTVRISCIDDYAGERGREGEEDEKCEGVYELTLPERCGGSKSCCNKGETDKQSSSDLLLSLAAYAYNLNLGEKVFVTPTAKARPHHHKRQNDRKSKSNKPHGPLLRTYVCSKRIVHHEKEEGKRRHNDGGEEKVEETPTTKVVKEIVLEVSRRWNHPFLYSSCCELHNVEIDVEAVAAAAGGGGGGTGTGAVFSQVSRDENQKLVCHVCCRHRDELRRCVLSRVRQDDEEHNVTMCVDRGGDVYRWSVAFLDAPVRAVTPGQAAVFYLPLPKEAKRRASSGSDEETMMICIGMGWF